ncbi:uncharacterized protein FSUBG_8483 [Fusarium subglutinans]|uniref:WSC domain-containing protein n=1 Tax=Gibberella subglutinans TaxID=42677 RepID=A0A8H5PIH8_GIBSU|nr:uncharacterized protein FSUBG_8483 [Fusarium subglutinans]KAF5597450.1 hypothetical protein FSUBG_8483 [Fusarium subglutinans]
MRFTNPKLLAVFTALPLLARSFSITETTSGATVAAAIFDGPGLNVLNVISLGESSMGTFADGPFGLGSGGILTSGTATGAYISGDRNVDNGVAGYDYVCAPNTQNVNALQVQVGLEPGYNGVRIEFVFATQEALSTLANMDAISILDVTNGPPLHFVVLVISVCDVGDALNDSGFLLRAEGCVDCGYGSDEVKINYVYTTSTLPPGEQPFTSTISASGTASGTFIVFVEPTGVTTTTSDATTTTTAEETTTTGETTTTTDELTTLTTAEPKTTTKDDSTTTTPTTTAVDELTTTELVSTTEQTTSVSFESTATTADVTSESVSTTLEITTTEKSMTSISSELETLTTDEVSSSTDESTSSTPAESRTTTDASPILSTASEAASTSVDQGPVLASDTTTSESIVPTTDALSESTTSITSESSSVTAAVSSESTASSIVSTGLPSPSSESTSFADTSTSTSQVVPETTFTPVEPVTSSSPEISTTSSSDAPPATSSPADGPSNIDTIRGYTYKGCLGSADGYPSFNLIGSGANMTTSSCVTLARGRAYVGIYDRSCYASDSLDSTSLVLSGRCDIPCPGDSSHFCGGLVVSSSERRWAGPRKALDKRAAPANILLTLYALDNEPRAPSETSTEAEVPATTQDGVTVIPTDVISSRQIVTATDIVTESLILQPVETVIDSVAQPGQTLVETTVTTVTYTIVDPNNPSTLTVTEYCATLSYEPCSRCVYPPIPTVEMTTYVMPCKSCGYHDQNRVTITAPCAAVTEPARNDAYGSQDLVGDFAPTRAAYQVVPGPVRTVTTALRQAKPTAGAESSTIPYQHQKDDREDTYPGAGHAQPHAVSSLSSSGASGNGTAVPGVVVAEAGRYERGILGFLTMAFIAMRVLL